MPRIYNPPSTPPRIHIVKGGGGASSHITKELYEQIKKRFLVKS